MKYCVWLGVAFCLGCGGAENAQKINANGKGSDGQKEMASPETRSLAVRNLAKVNALKEVQDINKFKMLALALHNHQDVYRRLPFVVSQDMPRHEKLSWRIDSLPYLEFNFHFDKFDRSQAWDSAKNKPLVKSEAKSAFELSNGNLICAISAEKRPKRLQDIHDGTANTIMAIENPNAKGEQWTQAVDLDIQDAIQLVKSLKKGEYLLACTFAGSTKKIYWTEGRGISDKEIEAIFGHNEGFVVNNDIFNADSDKKKKSRNLWGIEK